MPGAEWRLCVSVLWGGCYKYCWVLFWWVPLPFSLFEILMGEQTLPFAMSYRWLIMMYRIIQISVSRWLEYAVINKYNLDSRTLTIVATVSTLTNQSKWFPCLDDLISPSFLLILFLLWILTWYILMFAAKVLYEITGVSLWNYVVDFIFFYVSDM